MCIHLFSHVYSGIGVYPAWKYKRDTVLLIIKLFLKKKDKLYTFLMNNILHNSDWENFKNKMYFSLFIICISLNLDNENVYFTNIVIFQSIFLSGSHAVSQKLFLFLCF